MPLALVLRMSEEEGVYPSPQTVGTRSQLPGPEFPVGWGKNGGEGLGRLRLQVGWGSQAGKCISSSQAVLTHTPKPLSKQQLGSVLGQTTSPPSLPPPSPSPTVPPRAVWASTDHQIWFTLPALRQVPSPIWDSVSPSI